MCGYCSLEQALGDKCAACEKRLASSAANPLGRNTRFWEGGQGCRDINKLSRKGEIEMFIYVCVVISCRSGLSFSDAHKEKDAPYPPTLTPPPPKLLLAHNAPSPRPPPLQEQKQDAVAKAQARRAQGGQQAGGGSLVMARATQHTSWQPLVC